jgi:hypothetical protein
MAFGIFFATYLWQITDTKPSAGYAKARSAAERLDGMIAKGVLAARDQAWKRH